MTINPSDEPRLWAEFQAHIQACPICRNPDRHLCDEGLRLEGAWGLVNAVCERRDQEGLDDLTDCADERPWSPEL
jgi:hypothetical protein